MKKILWIVLLVMVLLIGWRVYVKINNAKAEGNPTQGRSGAAVAVEVTQVAVKTMQDIGHFSGSLKPRSGYSVAPKVSGRLVKLLVNLGDKVSNGQLLAVLDDDIYQQSLEQAQTELTLAQAQVEQTRLAYKAAEANWTAVKSLYEQNYSTKAVMDQTDAEKAAAKAKYDMSVAEVQRAKTIVKTAEIQLSYTQIKANWTGGAATRVVGERFVDAGNMLSANTPILTLIDNSIVTAEIDVIERDYPRVKLGQAVQINSDAYPERTFTGKLARLAPTLQESSRQAKAEIDIPNGEGLLKPGMFVRVQIVYAQHANVRVVPVTAIVERDGKQGVFIANSSSMTASFVPLEIGIKDAEFAEVLDAALEGDVIVLGQEMLQDGGKIKLPKPKEKEAIGKGNNGAKP